MKIITKKNIMLFITSIFFYTIFSIFFTDSFKLVVDVNSDSQGTSIIYIFPKNSSHIEISANIHQGANQLTFPLPRNTFQKNINSIAGIRWDPIAGNGKFELKNAVIHLEKKSFPIDLKRITAIFDIEKIQYNYDKLNIETTARAKDPQLLIPSNAIDESSINMALEENDKIRGFLLVSISILCALITLFVYNYREKIFSIFIESRFYILTNQGLKKLESFVISLSILIKKLIITEKKVIYSFPYFFSIAFVFNFIYFGPVQLVIDSELAANNGLTYEHLKLGRWVIAFYEAFVVQQPVIPYLPVLIFCIFITFAYQTILRAHNLSANWITYLLFPIFCAHPILNFTLLFNTISSLIAPGIFIVALSAYIFKIVNVRCILEGSHKLFSWKHILAALTQILLIALSIGIVQSNLFLAGSLYLGVLLITLNSKNDYKIETYTKTIVLMLIILFLGLILYRAINLLTLYAFNVKTVYIDHFVNPSFLIKNPFEVIFRTINEAKKVYLGSSSLYETSIWGIGLMMILGAISYITKCIASSRRGFIKLILIMLALICLFLPFSLNLLNFGYMPYRTMFGVPYVSWLFGYFALSQRIYTLKYFAIFSVMFSNFQCLYISSLYSATKEARYRHDVLLATLIYDRIGLAHDDFSRSKIYPVVFSGTKGITTVYPDVPNTFLNQSYFQEMDSYAIRKLLFMKYLGFTNLEYAISPEKYDPEFEKMPEWPGEGSVRNFNGVTLIKIGNDHVNQKQKTVSTKKNDGNNQQKINIIHEELK